MNAYQGQNTSIICNYPVEYEKHYKYITKLDNDSVVKSMLETHTNSQSSRFSVSEDRSAKVLSVNISDVREADDGVYLCGAIYSNLVKATYLSYFTEIQLHVKGETFIHVRFMNIHTNRSHNLKVLSALWNFLFLSCFTQQPPPPWWHQRHRQEAQLMQWISVRTLLLYITYQ